MTESQVSGRRELPHRRESLNLKAVIHSRRGRTKLYVTVGLYPDGSPGEVFAILEQVGSQERALIDNVVRTLSIGLQHGVPLARFVELYEGTRFEPFGPVSCHSRIKVCTSPLDLLARILGVEFCGRDDLAHLPETPTVPLGE